AGFGRSAGPPTPVGRASRCGPQSSPEEEKNSPAIKKKGIISASRFTFCSISRAMKEAPTLELVLKRNSVERMKRDKTPLGMLDELPALIAAGYEQVDEEDLVRLKWWGLYHDKPKIGTFMLRIKIPGGVTSPAQLHAIGEISNVHGRGEGELTTRQNVQLHFIELGALPAVFEHLHAAGLT